LAIWGFLRSHALDKMALDTKIDGQVKLANNKLEQAKKKEAPKASPKKVTKKKG